MRNGGGGSHHGEGKINAVASHVRVDQPVVLVEELYITVFWGGVSLALQDHLSPAARLERGEVRTSSSGWPSWDFSSGARLRDLHHISLMQHMRLWLGTATGQHQHSASTCICCLRLKSPCCFCDGQGHLCPASKFTSHRYQVSGKET